MSASESKKALAFNTKAVNEFIDKGVLEFGMAAERKGRQLITELKVNTRG